MKRLIQIEVYLQDAGGVTIWYGGEFVATGLNIMEAFMTLAGMLESGPQRVKLTIMDVSDGFKRHYETGRKAVAQAAPRFSAKEKLELVEIGGPGTNTMCPLRHKGASIRILRTRGSRTPVGSWFQCPQGHGTNHWPFKIEEACRSAVMPRPISKNTPGPIVLLDAEFVDFLE